MQFAALTIDRLQTLIDINSRMHTNYSDIGALIKYILELAMRFVGCEASSLALVHKEETALRLMMMLGLDNIETAGLSVVMNSIGGKVVKDNKPLIINDIASDLWIDNGFERRRGSVVRTMAVVPLCMRRQCIGVIVLVNRMESVVLRRTTLKSCCCLRSKRRLHIRTPTVIVL